LSTEARPAAASAALNRGRIYVLLAGLLWSLAGVFNELPRSKLTGYQNKSRITCSIVTPACL